MSRGTLSAPTAILALLVLAGCQKAVGSSPRAAESSRYQGVGTYPAGRMWKQVAAPASADKAAAGLRDDEQVIVVIDSQTGELRQCGNLSGFCIGMNPWAAGGAPGRAPVSLSAHAEQLDAADATPAKAAR